MSTRYCHVSAPDPTDRSLYFMGDDDCFICTYDRASLAAQFKDVPVTSSLRRGFARMLDRQPVLIPVSMVRKLFGISRKRFRRAA